MALKGISIIGGGGGASSFSELLGAPGDNVALAASLAAKQDQSGKLDAVSAVGATAGLLENVSGSAATVRALGVAAATSVPTRADVDTRFARMFTSMPAGGVGVDGDYGILTTEALRGVLISKVAGAWGLVSESFTWTQMQAIASPVTGMTVLVTTIAVGGTIGNTTVNSLFRYNGTFWRPLSGRIKLHLAANVTGVINASTYNSIFTMAPPAGLFLAGCTARWDVRLRWVSGLTANSGATAQPRINFNSTLLTSPNNNNTGHQSGTARLWSATDNFITGGGNNVAGWGNGTSTTDAIEVTTASAFNGTHTLDFGYAASAGDSTKTWGFAYSDLDLFYPTA